MDELEYLIKNTCYSLWDGCSCDLPVDHEGLHECPACKSHWTDEQAEEFMAEVRRVMVESTDDHKVHSNLGVWYSDCPDCQEGDE